MRGHWLFVIILVAIALSPVFPAVAASAPAQPVAGQVSKPVGNKPSVRSSSQTNKNADRSGSQTSRSAAGGRGDSRTVAETVSLAVTRPEHMTSQQMREQIVQTTFSQLGVAYRAGGSTPAQGFDCSGYTSWIYAMVDIKLPRTSREQFKVGTAVNKADLVPGDLVFFKYGRSISHVGIYVDNDFFIHSPNKNREITLNNLNSRGWVNNYAGARRIVPDK